MPMQIGVECDESAPTREMGHCRAWKGHDGGHLFFDPRYLCVCRCCCMRDEFEARSLSGRNDCSCRQWAHVGSNVDAGQLVVALRDRGHHQKAGDLMRAWGVAKIEVQLAQQLL